MENPVNQQQIPQESDDGNMAEDQYDREKYSVCSICLAILGCEFMVLSPCGHIFHSICFEKSRLNDERCPMCRLVPKSCLNYAIPDQQEELNDIKKERDWLLKQNSELKEKLLLKPPQPQQANTVNSINNKRRSSF